VTKPVRIVFMGSPDFAVPSLEALAEHYTVAGVITQPDRPAGRRGILNPPAVKEAAIRLSIPVIQPEKLSLPDALIRLKEWDPDLIVVVAYGQILRPTVLDLPCHGCLNIHGSLLPRWRGAAPIQAAILGGDQVTGITIMKMDPGVDTGPILNQCTIPICHTDSGGSLSTKLAPLGAEILIETLPQYLSGRLVPRSQPDSGATYAPMLKKEDGVLDFQKPALELERRVRAMNPWPGAYFEWNGSLLKVHKARVVDDNRTRAGQRLVVEGLPAMGTGAGVLILEEIQPAGKRCMPGKAFLSGARTWGNQ
jgi:methionyl-tRNA formyltransferase